MGLINITDADLKKSATTYRRDLLMMPVIAAERTLRHMTGRPGVAGRETIGELSGDIELGPYDPKRVDEDGVNITPRTLETFLGSVIKRFDVNEAAKTVYGELFAQGQQLTTAYLSMQVLNFLAGKLGRGLNMSIWSAVRNDKGSKTKDLFDGFDTITANEVAAGAIVAEKGNYLSVDAIDNTNAVDTLKTIFESASDELQETPTKLFIPRGVYTAYVKDYQSTVGAVPYNTQYKKTFLEGSDDLCELVPLVSKKGSKFLHLTTKGNMLYGYGAGLAQENIAIEKHHELLLSFVATMYFGTQFESISSERLMVAEVKEAGTDTSGGDSKEPGTGGAAGGEDNDSENP